MTAIRGYVPATEQARLGVHSLDHFVLAVPDLVPAQRFYAIGNYSKFIRPGGVRAQNWTRVA